MSKTVRDQALDAIKAGQSVVINGQQYTKDNIEELPAIEEFGEVNQEEAYNQLKKEHEALTARLKAVEGKSSTKSESHTAKEDKKGSSAKDTDESESK